MIISHRPKTTVLSAFIAASMLSFIVKMISMMHSAIFAYALIHTVMSFTTHMAFFAATFVHTITP
jgi:hypothetical protein